MALLPLSFTQLPGYEPWEPRAVGAVGGVTVAEEHIARAQVVQANLCGRRARVVNRGSDSIRCSLHNRQHRAHRMFRNRQGIRHVIARLPFSREIKIELMLEDRFREVAQAQQRILHGLAKKPPAQQLVVDGNPAGSA
jgi:hypothetical protein